MGIATATYGRRDLPKCLVETPIQGNSDTQSGETQNTKKLLDRKFINPSNERLLVRFIPIRKSASK